MLQANEISTSVVDTTYQYSSDADLIEKTLEIKYC
jgi:hypothetical protein